MAATDRDATGLLPGGAHATRRKGTAGLALLALGVVYGDIGTSPLYAVKETFSPQHGIALDAAAILGGASAIFWALMMVVSLKYVTLVLRADNRGEGGIMALLALAASSAKAGPRMASAIVVAGVFGASLFYGDAVLTPAISVLSAIEGLEVGTAAFKHYVVPIAVIVLMTLFNAFSHGTQDLYPLFLQVEKGYGTDLAGKLSTIGPLGTIVGGLFFGALSERIGRKRAIVLAALLSLPILKLWAFSDTPLLLGLGAFWLQVMVQNA